MRNFLIRRIFRYSLANSGLHKLGSIQRHLCQTLENEREPSQWRCHHTTYLASCLPGIRADDLRLPKKHKDWQTELRLSLNLAERRILHGICVLHSNGHLSHSLLYDGLLLLQDLQKALEKRREFDDSFGPHWIEEEECANVDVHHPDFLPLLDAV